MVVYLLETTKKVLEPPIGHIELQKHCVLTSNGTPDLASEVSRYTLLCEAPDTRALPFSWQYIRLHWCCNCILGIWLELDLLRCDWAKSKPNECSDHSVIKVQWGSQHYFVYQGSSCCRAGYHSSPKCWWLLICLHSLHQQLTLWHCSFSCTFVCQGHCERQ